MSAPFRSKRLRTLFDLADLYADLNETQRERLMADVRGSLGLWLRQPPMIRWFFRLCGRVNWLDDDKGLVHVAVRMGEGEPAFFEQSVAMAEKPAADA